VLQHTPPAQKPETHCDGEPHGAPFAWSPLHCETPESHHALAAHCASLVQLVPQLALEPVHRYTPHEGEPELPVADSVHVPSAVAPSASAHTSHEPAQLVLQQVPSTQPPGVLHSRQPATRQWPPAATSHRAPCAFLGWQVLPLAQ